MFYGVDIYYIIIVIPAALFALYAMYKARGIFRYYSKDGSIDGMTGADLAREILYIKGIYNVEVEPVSGKFTDHYDPGSKKLKLSESVYYGDSVAALGIAAHEAGHAVQQKAGYKLFILRSAIVPIANIASAAGPVLAVSGILFSWPFMFELGIILFTTAMTFYLITLPVEYDASRRATDTINTYGILNWSEIKQIKKVLAAAAITYVASAVTAAANLLRLVILTRGIIRK